MPIHRIGPALATLLTALVCARANGQFNLVSQSRTVGANADIFDGPLWDSDSMQEWAPDFGPFDAVAQASASLNGATASAIADQDSVAQGDFLSAVITAHAALDTPGLEFAGGSSSGTYDVVFDVDSTIDVLIKSERSSTWSAPGIYGQTFVQLWRVIPCPQTCDVDEDCPFSDCGGDPNPGDGNPQGTCIFDNCLMFDAITCGTVFTLEPGRYQFIVTAVANAYEDFGGAAAGTADAAVIASLRPTDQAAGEVAFDVDVNQSSIDLMVQFPGGQPQTFSLTVEGALSLLMAFSCDFDNAQLTSLALAVPEQVDLVPPPGLAPGGLISVTGIGVNLSSPGGPAALTGGSGVLPDYEVQMTGAVAGPEQPGVVLMVVLTNCLIELLCGHPDGCTCFADPETDCFDFAPGGPFTLTLPGINIVAPIDLGLGAGNPTAQITGDIVATAVLPESCPWDCGDGDGLVGITDFLAMLGQWGGQGTTCDLGLGGPGVGIDEFLALLGNWGPCQ